MAKIYPVFGEFMRRGKALADMKLAGNRFKIAIIYRYEQVVSEYQRITYTNETKNWPIWSKPF
ncbi:hypothetical protein [Emticicia fontis]